jgi:diguanylate cyclase (GGDEF)-like protein
MSAQPTAQPALRRSWIDVIGLGGRPKAVRLLTVVIVGAALLIAVGGTLLPVALPVGRPFPAVVGIVVAAALAAAAQLARLRFRLGRGVVSVAWGEAAFILGFVVAPPGWLPLATLIGVAIAWALLSWLSEHRNVADVAHLTASLALGSAGAALVTALIVGDAGPATVRMQLGLTAGATVYLAITFALAVLTLKLHQDADTRQILARVPYAKVPIFVGSVIIGLGAVFALLHQPLWLAAFVPFLWLLQRSYRFHLRAEEERRMWESFAEATSALPGGSIEDVVAAGLRGALTVFGAQRAEIEVRGEDGLARYAEDGPGVESPAAGLPGPAITRTMAVAGEVIGELTVWLSEPTLPVPRDEAAISAYGDALAGALHDAAAHEQVAELRERVAYETVHDLLTGLMNRTTLVSEGDRVTRALVEKDKPIALLLLDVNDFREVNGTLGHRCGDEVLRLVAERLTELTREGELVARIGDDEFALLVPSLATLADSTVRHESASGLPQALRRARDIVEELSRPMEVSGVRLAVEVAVGVAVTPAGRTDLVELVRRASLALDQAKAAELAVATYDPSQDAVTTDGLALLAELHDALAADDQIVLHLQPAVDLITAAPTGVEALVRWQHPRRGRLSPGDFIRTVEHTELLGPFTRRVLDLALTMAVDWTAAGIDLPVSVNVAARSLLDPTFPAQVADALRRHRLPASSLVLEITESVAVSEQDIVDDVLGELRDSGVQLSLDDFGTGYSSLSIVTRVPVDEIKIDRSFVDDMIDLPAAEAVVRGAVELGSRLGVRVVAEGVETTEQRAALMALNCPTAQGYHFCKPMPADRIVSALIRLTEAAGGAEVVPLRADDAS